MNRHEKIQELTKRVQYLQLRVASDLATTEEKDSAVSKIKELTAEINRLLDESIAARLD